MTTGRRDPADRWRVAAADHPVRGRVRLPPEVTPLFPAALAAATFAAAAVVTGGTVLVRDLPAGDDPLSAAARTVFDRAGGYVVRSADGLTVTTRSTSGELAPLDVDLTSAAALVPLVAGVAAVAGGRSVLRGVDVAAVAPLVGDLRAVGVAASVADGSLLVETAALRPGVWIGDDPALAAAGLVLGLVVDGLEVTGMRELRRVLPGVEREWLRLLVADEYLIPGSAKLPHDYL